jgi:hypothetical protein
MPHTKKRPHSIHKRRTRRRGMNHSGGEGELNAFFLKANDFLTSVTGTVKSKLSDITTTLTVTAQNTINAFSDIFKAKPASPLAAISNRN